MSQPPARRGRPKAMFPAEAPGTIQALDRALEVIDLLSQREGMTLTEIAVALDQSVATMHRVLATLEAREFVELAPERQDWHIGPGAFRAGSAFLRRTNVAERARPEMRALMTECGETSNLGVDWKGQVLFLSQVECHEIIRAFFPPGTVASKHASGIGKALLSQYPPLRLATYLASAPFERFTARSLTSASELAADLAKARAAGYAVDDEERTPGMRCVAAAILNVHGEAIAGISVSGPSQRLSDDRIAGIGHMVSAAAGRIGKQLGAGQG
ncbi:HTH-type transcriptional regulator BhcR [Pseudogemmobacter faecipullorum]|uniref:IclR family transcriptional regulator n=1 Tax=Pseudogemmobacter faecipullorum TaxID=2755041 RepID=A0ABS8CPE3_9RHOB|nr:HTH-type transcriptional regulator BhcR [Pseudogemmobacter faecipullorum]MCB5411265.1 IclR family transcriptional regulator [Pseudogemmobacter faecipullorum]